MWRPPPVDVKRIRILPIANSAQRKNWSSRKAVGLGRSQESGTSEGPWCSSAQNHRRSSSQPRESQSAPRRPPTSPPGGGTAAVSRGRDLTARRFDEFRKTFGSGPSQTGLLTREALPDRESESALPNWAGR